MVLHIASLQSNIGGRESFHRTSDVVTYWRVGVRRHSVGGDTHLQVRHPLVDLEYRGRALLLVMAFCENLDWLVRVRGRKEKVKIDSPLLRTYLARSRECGLSDTDRVMSLPGNFSGDPRLAFKRTLCGSQFELFDWLLRVFVQMGVSTRSGDQHPQGN